MKLQGNEKPRYKAKLIGSFSSLCLTSLIHNFFNKSGTENVMTPLRSTAISTDNTSITHQYKIQSINTINTINTKEDQTVVRKKLNDLENWNKTEGMNVISTECKGMHVEPPI